MTSRAATLIVAVAIGLAFWATSCTGDDGDAEMSSAADTSDPAAAASAVSVTQLDVVSAETDNGPDDESASDDISGASDSEVDPLDPLMIQGQIINEANLILRDCFNRVEGLQAGRRVSITSRLDCETPHSYEVFHTFEIDAPHPSIHPGDSAMDDYARKACYDQFEAFVGEIYELSIYEIGVFTPDRASFEHHMARYRRVHCWLYRTDSELSQGSAQGTGV